MMGRGWAWLLALGLIAGCGDGPQLAEGIFAPMGEPRPSATPEQLATFERGEQVAVQRFTRETGLGPEFNVTFCAACHEKPVFGGSSARYRNFLIVGQRLSDGSFTTTGVNGIQPQYTLGPEERHLDAEGNWAALRNAIPFFGVGLLAEIPEEEILRRADEDDADGDGISGRPNFDRGFVGRFGRKAQTVSIEGFIRGPLFNHVGITSNPLSDELKAALPVPSVADPDQVVARAGSLEEGVGGIRAGQAAAPAEPTVDDDGVPDPELSEQQLFDLVSWAMLLAAPEPAPPTPETEEGAALFAEAGCEQCHVPALRGPRGLVPAYSDLLLHDMGDAMADGIEMGLPGTGREFRTQPLWGLAAVGPYLHDGRADTIEEAIAHHGGEASASRDAFQAMSTEEQDRILAFLLSLGGGAQRTDGLIPPGAPIPEAGSYGGPARALSDAERERFLRGREVFDRDFFDDEGLGPFFNGDSCRACHFDPVPGGSGPGDVDVSRHGMFDDATQTFTAPAQGTMAHRHSLGPERPPIDPDANVFEVRQTPPIFGLGSIDRIPEAVIVAGEDPTDLDGDGISGRAHVLGDGRVGRLGWKANVPSLAEFARDAMSNEMGVSLPEQPGLTFGFPVDGDDVPDPELPLDELEDLIFFMRALAPPPRTRTDVALEDMGEGLFATVGCADCHVPSLPADDGTPVPLYSDLLLHDVVPPGVAGIGEGDATHREFRTPPLWGLGETAPYMHDGRAFSVEEAIAQHESEAQAARLAYEALSAEERAALIAFLESL